VRLEERRPPSGAFAGQVPVRCHGP
jgi:hypothetical protein